jgi:hypothetical protein
VTILPERVLDEQHFGDVRELPFLESDEAIVIRGRYRYATDRHRRAPWWAVGLS